MFVGLCPVVAGLHRCGTQSNERRIDLPGTRPCARVSGDARLVRAVPLYMSQSNPAGEPVSPVASSIPSAVVAPSHHPTGAVPSIDSANGSGIESINASKPRRRRAPRVWRRFVVFWRDRSPAQQLTLGFLSWVLIGWLALCLPWAQSVPVGPLDNLFGVVSAISTTGLATVPTGDSYTFFGELVHLILFQLGGIGYMTLSSFILLATGRAIGRSREGILKVGFTLPHYFRLDRFIKHVIVFTLVCEALGAAVLYVVFTLAGKEDALWSAIFHSVSAFATAGFGLYSNSLEDFRHSLPVNLTIGLLCYAGAIGFIVVQDVWYSFRLRERMLTFTSKIILWMTAILLLFGTAVFYFVEPSISELGAGDRLMAAVFQVMSASSTAGFNTIPVGPLGLAALWVIVIVMLIGASPSGTGGGIKTTSASALLAAVISTIRGRTQVSLFGNEIPQRRLNSAAAAATLYLMLVSTGVLALLCVLESPDFVKVLFEVTSAIGTVGLSMGLTGELGTAGKWVVIGLMFVGRVGPLTLGLALFAARRNEDARSADDLAT